MKEFLYIILTMPTVVYTVFLAFVILYWITVIAGAVDIDLFDLDADLDADVDLDLDADIDLDADADVDVDADIDADADVDGGGPGVLVTVLSALGLVGIPLTISMSIFAIANWSFTFLLTYFLGGAGRALGALEIAGVLGGSFVLSLMVTSLAARPLKPLFRSKSGARAADALVGRAVRLTSGRVTPTGGRAETDLGGSTASLSIRCEDPGNGLGRGDEALIIGYDAEAHVYFVEPMGVVFGDSAQQNESESVEEAFERLEADQNKEVAAAAAREDDR